jgi:putative Mg2+ transporter-C (MgtC) family protein
VTGAVGIAVGLGGYDVAILLAIVTMVTLWVMEPLKRAGHLDVSEHEAPKPQRRT